MLVVLSIILTRSNHLEPKKEIQLTCSHCFSKECQIKGVAIIESVQQSTNGSNTNTLVYTSTTFINNYQH
jgi:hypothetical protein